MRLLTVDSLINAREKLIEAVGAKPCPTERIAITEALGRILAEDIKAPLMVPDFRRSTVDGYAVLAKDTWGASESVPVFLEVIGETYMGCDTQYHIAAGECVYVPTGGILPSGADGVVMVEYCEIFDDNHIAVYDAVAQGKNIVEIGEDTKVGDLLLTKGAKIEAKNIATLAAVGVAQVNVFEPLTVAIFSTGDELVATTEKRQMGQIFDINTYGLRALAMKNGMQVKVNHIIKDDKELLSKAVRKAMAENDVVLVSGGSSQGKKDVTEAVLDEVATPGVFTHGLSLKPGKPTILGYDEKSQTILAGLPGHPVAAMLVFELLIIWLNRRRFAMKESLAFPATMETNLASAPGRATCQMVKLIKGESGYIARPIFGKSGLITTLSEADGYVIIDMNKEGIVEGEFVEVHLL